MLVVKLLSRLKTFKVVMSVEVMFVVMVKGGMRIQVKMMMVVKLMMRLVVVEVEVVMRIVVVVNKVCHHEETMSNSHILVPWWSGIKY